MQLALDFGACGEIVRLRGKLRGFLGDLPGVPVREPIGQLIKSMISGRTRDAVSLEAYGRLRERYPRWCDLAGATAADIERLIAEVTYADVKAGQVVEALKSIASEHPDFDLGFLARWPRDQALAWLEALPGVGRKVAASALNFSTLGLPAFVADTHVLRILSRFGLIDRRATSRAGYDRVMAAATDWTAGELAELHVLLKRLGQTVCRPKAPLCEACPLQGECRGPRVEEAAQAN